MTPDQQNTLDLINKLNAAEFAGWFTPSSVMAFVQVESNFRSRAYRKEPSGVASYGLCQVLDETAKGLGFEDDPAKMFFPEVSLRYGMKYMRVIWNELAHGLGHDPTLIEWCSAYNEGPGNVLRGRKDTAYAVPWMAAKAHWTALVDGLPDALTRRQALGVATAPARPASADSEADDLNRAELENPNPGLV